MVTQNTVKGMRSLLIKTILHILTTVTLLCNSNAHLLQVVTQYLIPLSLYTAWGQSVYDGNSTELISGKYHLQYPQLWLRQN